MHNVYIHIPFCAQMCSYCTFAKQVSLDTNRHEEYVFAVKKEIETRFATQKQEKIKTLYFGGGTPSLIKPEYIQDIILFLQNLRGFAHDVEICLEAHPLTLTKEKIEVWQSVGVNRISLGVQTFQKKFDVFLERNLSGVFDAIHLLQESKIRWSIDMIFGFPNQTEKDLKADLEHIKNLQPEHISFYALDYKINSKIELQQEDSLLFEDIQRFYEIIQIELEKMGYEHYEIYNFVKNNSYSRHNLNFWNGEDYLGFGVSAVSQVGTCITENTFLFDEYLKGFFGKSYNLSNEEYLENFLKRRLRLSSGVNREELQSFLEEMGNQSWLEKIEENARTISSWISFSENSFFLTGEGKLFFSEVLDVLMEAIHFE